MSTMLDGRGAWSSFKFVLQKWRDWLRNDPLGDMRYCGENEIERIANDIRVSASELRALASQRPETTDLLLRRMAALDLNQDEVSETAPGTLHDLQRVCAMCDCRRRCARDFVRDSATSEWKDYCPNAATLMMLDALPWATRRDW